VDDIEENWTWSTPFDLIHSRMMTGSVSDWPKLFASAYEHLTPGGWIQLTDCVFPVRCDDGTMPASSPTLKWANLFVDALNKIGKPCDSALRYKEQLEVAGFVDVKEVVYKWPSNKWPKDKKMKELGMWQVSYSSRPVDTSVRHTVDLFYKVRELLWWSRIYQSGCFYKNIGVVYRGTYSVPGAGDEGNEGYDCSFIYSHVCSLTHCCDSANML
jgi:hypothetical protein